MQDSKREGAEQHVTRLKTQLEELIAHLKDDVLQVEDEKAKVLFEVSAEVLGGNID